MRATAHLRAGPLRAAYGGFCAPEKWMGMNLWPRPSGTFRGERNGSQGLTRTGALASMRKQGMTLDRSRFRKFVDPPDMIRRSAMVNLASGRPLEPKLTPFEREVVAITTTAPPTSLLTLNSAELGLEDVRAAWTKFRKRLWRSHGKDVVAIASTQITSKGTAGFHVHALLWTGFVHISKLRHCVEETGFGPPYIRMVPDPNNRFYGTLASVAYVYGQHGAILGSTHGRENLPLARGQQRVHKSHTVTLTRSAPELLSALDMAKSPTVTDVQLVQSSPLFISNRDAILAPWKVPELQ